MRRIVPGGDHPTIGPAIAVPGGVGEPTLASFDGRLALLLWRSPDRPIGLRLIDIAGPEPRFGREEESDFASAVPVAAVEARDGETPAFCVGLVEPKDPEHRSWTEVRRFVRTTAGRWRESRREWVNGEVPGRDGASAVRRPRRASDVALVASRAGLRGARPALPLQRERDDRRSALVRAVHHDAGRCPRNRHRLVLAPLSTCPPASQRVGAGACWFRDDIAYAVRVHDDKPEHNDVVKLGFYGSGALPEPMSDFNDVAFIAARGPEPFDHRRDAANRGGDARPSRADSA